MKWTGMLVVSFRGVNHGFWNPTQGRSQDFSLGCAQIPFSEFRRVNEYFPNHLNGYVPPNRVVILERFRLLRNSVCRVASQLVFYCGTSWYLKTKI